MKYTLLAIILCFIAAPSFAQEASRRLDELDLLKPDRMPSSVTQQPGIALESTVDPSRYHVGPSDIISVNIWMSPPLNFNLTVTPEGTLIIPTVGEVALSDMPLAEAKEKILREVRKKYLTAQITATLVRPRPIVVTVTGNVLNEGLYTLTAIDRANKAIEEANRLSRTQQQYELENVLYQMSTRNIVLKHRDGTEDRVDIAKFLATKEDRWNTYLREGDVIVVPRKNPEKYVFGIYGEVNAPGRYEYVAGDSLLDAIRIAYGFTQLALLDSVEFSRLSPDGRSMQTRLLAIKTGAGGVLENFPLEPGDRIVVKAKDELREDYRVSVTGEVPHPGTYPITKDRTHLSDVIRKAGGFTEYAAMKSASLNRRSVRPEEVETERLMSVRGGVSPEDSTDYLLETTLRLRREIVNVDFQRLFEKGDSTQDVILRDGDEIIIPSIRQTIYVFGQIVSPGHIPFVEGEDADYYVSKAGGLTDRARGGDIRVIKAKTKQWLDPDDTAIEEGDYIWVPKDPDRPFGYYMNIASQAASVLSVVVGIGVLIVQLAK